MCVKSATRPQAAPPTPPPEAPGDADTAPRIGAIASLPATLPPEELREIGIPEDLVTRYVALKKKKALEKDPNTIYCPRQWCQAPSRASVQQMEQTMKRNGSGYWLLDRDTAPSSPPSLQENIVPKKREEEKPSPLKEKLQVCSVCSFAFCRVCLGKYPSSPHYRLQLTICAASWHGDFQICKPADGTLTEEEIANENFLRANTTPCPTCQSPVLKSHGCNHMICTCATHFCFLCSAYLPAENPYTHFNTRGKECYQRLWEGEEGDIENQRAVLEQPENEEQVDDLDEEEEVAEP
jgi:E3 ubiquitin-protein ligase RNF14